MENWIISDNKLCREFTFKNFIQSVEFVNQITPIAEQMNHHPDILIYGYKHVKVMLFTHSQNKITSNDYLLAEKIDKLYN